MTLDQEILNELKLQNRILVLSNADRIESEISKYASTDDRKRIWALINEANNSQTIATKLQLTPRAVDIFLKLLENAGMIERTYGKPPKKLLDYTPAKWLELLPQEALSQKSPPTDTLQTEDKKSDLA